MVKRLMNTHFYPKEYALIRLCWISLICLLIVSCTTIDREPGQLFLLFVHRTSQASYVYAANLEDSKIREIGEFPSASSYWLSPTGNYLAVLDETLQIIDLLSDATEFMSLDNVGQTRFESIFQSENIVWSPQGDKLVFLRNADVGDGVEVVLLDLRNNTTRTLSSTHTIHRAPAWSPDGNYVAWATLANACDQPPIQCAPKEQYWNLTIAELSSNNWYEIDLASVIKENQLEGIWQRSLCNLSWSATGTYIAFENACDPYGPSLNKEVFITSVTGSHFYQVTKFSNDNSLLSSVYSLHWDLSNNQLYTAYTTASFEPLVVGQDYGEGTILFKIDEAVYSGTTNLSTLNHTVVWAPDGYRMLWHHAGNPDTLFLGQIVDAETIDETTVHLTENVCFLDFASKQWSPDSRYIATVIGKETTDNGQSVCDSRSDTSLVILLNDGTIRFVGEPFQGHKQVLGWFSMK